MGYSIGRIAVDKQTKSLSFAHVIDLFERAVFAHSHRSCASG